MKTHKISHIIRVIWLLGIGIALYLYLFHKGLIEGQVSQIAGSPLYIRYSVYLLLGCFRSFTLIPVTSLIILGLLFISPEPLFILTIIGIIVSSASVYYFSEFMHLAEFFEGKYPKQISKLKSVLDKNTLSIVVLWSMFPFTPTDVVCYVCGSLRIDIKKLLLGVLIGESITCALYIFFGKEALMFLIGKF